MTHYLICDLKDDPRLISEYEQHHLPENAWPVVTDSIRAAGITGMEIFRAGNRLVMVMTTDDGYSPERQAEINASTPKVVEWEALMDRYQQRLPFAEHGAKWVPMHRIFDLKQTAS